MREPRTITIEGKDYLIRHANAFEQFSVARKLSPFFVKLYDEGKGSGTMAEELKRFEPIAEYIADLPEIKANELLYDCLCMVKVKIGEGLQPIVMKRGEQLIPYDDGLSMFIMLKLVFEVISENLSDFMKGASSLMSVKQQPTSP